MNWDNTWSTLQECLFVRDMGIKNRPAIEKYAEIVRAGMRRYDSEVNVAVVLKTIDEVLGVQ